MADTVPSARRPSEGAPTPFGAYQLLRRIGGGGMGEAFLAERTGPGDFRRRVCIKTILPLRSDDQDFLNWFLDEAKIHAQLHHAHIVQVYDFGERDGTYYLVLEYVEGCDLRGLMHALEDHGVRLPPDLVVTIAYEMALALEHAHKLEIDGVPQHLVHRDLTPANILLSTDGHAKLTDFGVVKAKSRITHTDTGLAKGKVPYMSPEQLQTSSIDGRTDLFALGVTLYELLAGSHPYRLRRDDNDMLIAKRICEGTRAPLAERASHAPAGLVRVVERLLDPDPTLRVGSASELLDMLTPHMPGPHASRELGQYVRAVRENAPFPASAIRAPSDSEAARKRRTEETAITHTLVRQTDVAHAQTTPAPRPLRGGRRVRVGVVALAVLLAAGVAVWQSRVQRAEPPVQPSVALEPEPPKQTAPLAVTKSAPPAASQPAAAGVETPEAAPPAPASQPDVTAPESARAESRARGKATLTVVVIPFGDVEIDGKRVKSASSLSLSAGTHQVRAGRNAALKHHETLRLRAGEQRELIIELAPDE